MLSTQLPSIDEGQLAAPHFGFLGAIFYSGKSLNREAQAID